MRRTLSILLLLLSLVSLACGSKPARRPATMPQPDIAAQLVNPIFFGSGASAPATIDVQVHNRGKEPLSIRRVEIDSPGMGQYTLARIVRYFNESVPPRESRKVTLFATAVAQTTNRPTEPLTIRIIVELQSQGQMWREVAMIRTDI